MTSQSPATNTMHTFPPQLDLRPDTLVPSFPDVGTELKATLIEIGGYYATMRLHGYDGIEAWCMFPEFGRTSASARYGRQLKRLQRTMGHIPVVVLRTDEARRLADVRVIEPIRIHV